MWPHSSLKPRLCFRASSRWRVIMWYVRRRCREVAATSVANGPTLLCSPVVHGAVELAVDRQVRALIWIFRCQGLVDIYTKPRCVARMHQPIFERIRMGKDPVGLRCVLHVFLNSEIVNAEIK